MRERRGRRGRERKETVYVCVCGGRDERKGARRREGGRKCESENERMGIRREKERVSEVERE